MTRTRIRRALLPRAVLARLNLHATAVGEPSGRAYNNLDPIWQHPTSGGRVSVGTRLRRQRVTPWTDRHGIRHVLNCEEEGSKNFFEEKGSRIQYMRFPISQWWRKEAKLVSHEAVLAYFSVLLFEWIVAATAAGSSVVLIHCLAKGRTVRGPRASPSSCTSGGLDKTTALPLAQRLRPIIDPVGLLGDILGKI